MGLETGTFVSDLVITNPPTSDLVAQGDDHLRLIKTVLKNTFPGASKAFYFPTATAKTANFTIAATEMLTTFLVDTTAGDVAATLPSLASGDAGWACFIMKTNTGLNPVFITPPSGTIQSGQVSGLSKTRRCIPGVACRVWWTGSAWIAERSERAPVGSTIAFHGASLPVGYEWPNGTSLSSAANYPDYNSVRGGLTTPDLRGRTETGRDDMGGSAAGRVTVGASGIDGVTLGASGGAQTVTLTTLEIPPHSHVASVTDPGHTHVVKRDNVATGGASNTLLMDGTSANTPASTNSGTTGITVSNANTGDGGAHNNMPPTLVANKILVVE